MVMDVNPGATGGTPNSSSPYGFLAVNGNEFFTATTSTQGTELWVNDGISTHITKDINAGNSGSNINLTPSPGNNYWAILGTKVYFTADNGLTGPEMWVSDGTTPGTQLVKDLTTAAGTGSGPHGYVVASS